MDKLLTLEEAAALMYVPVATLRFWRSTGQQGPPSGRLGKRVFYKEADCIAWVNAQFDNDRTAAS